MSKLEVDRQKGASMMILNDYCLFTIMEKLCVRDLMRLQQANKRLRNLGLLQFARCKELNFSTLFPNQMDTLTNEQFGQMVGWCHSSLTSLEVQIKNQLTIENVLNVIEDCANLETVIIGSRSGRCVHFSPLEKPQWIKISRVISQNVRELHLSKISCCLRDILLAFPNLEELSCSSIEGSSSTISLLTNKLKSLKIYAQDTDQENILNHFVPMLPELETFDFASLCYEEDGDVNEWFCAVTADFSNNRKLKEIHMKHWALYDDALKKLGDSIYGQLETIAIHDCSQITEEGFLDFLTTQPNLKTVDIRYYKDEPGLYVMRCLDYYVETRPVKEAPLTVIIDRISDTSEWSPLLNFVSIPNHFVNHRLLYCSICSFWRLLEKFEQV